ncbi:MAG: hypothetical protein ACU0CC_21995 [Sagittula sp.]|uniref:hypothetical protein n=1 Tax=Sagittula sp. TaxID=2038081 RepID=UPI004059DF0C
MTLRGFSFFMAGMLACLLAAGCEPEVGTAGEIEIDGVRYTVTFSKLYKHKTWYYVDLPGRPKVSCGEKPSDCEQVIRDYLDNPEGPPQPPPPRDNGDNDPPFTADVVTEEPEPPGPVEEEAPAEDGRDM